MSTYIIFCLFGRHLFVCKIAGTAHNEQQSCNNDIRLDKEPSLRRLSSIVLNTGFVNCFCFIQTSVQVKLVRRKKNSQGSLIVFLRLAEGGPFSVSDDQRRFGCVWWGDVRKKRLLVDIGASSSVFGREICGKNDYRRWFES